MLKLTIIGNLGADAEKKEKDGKIMIRFSVAVSTRKNEKTTWVNCFLNRDSKIIDYLKRGTQVYMEGYPTINVFKKESGEQITMFNLSINEIQLLSPPTTASTETK